MFCSYRVFGSLGNRCRQNHLKNLRVMQKRSICESENSKLVNNYEANENLYTANLSNGFLKVHMNPASPISNNGSNDIRRTDEVKKNPPHTFDNDGLNNLQTGGTESTDLIPDTVLQYERQLRKNKAAKKASTPISSSQLHVIHNDSNIIVANKPSGVLTVPGVNSNPNLLGLIYDTYNNEIEKDMKMEHMIIHRLDMDTSGIVIFAKDKKSMSELQKSFREREVDKEYEALVCGHLPSEVEQGSIDLPLQRDHRFPPFMRVATPESERQAKIVVKDLNHAGWKKIVKKNAKPSQTLFRVLSREFVGIEAGAEGQNQKLPVTRLKLIPETGRTHQLRVHCAAIGYPILGDPAYGVMGEASPNGGFDDESMNLLMPDRASLKLQLDLDRYVKSVNQEMCLHARRLCLRHPILEKKEVFEQAPSF